MRSSPPKKKMGQGIKKRGGGRLIAQGPVPRPVGDCYSPAVWGIPKLSGPTHFWFSFFFLRPFHVARAWASWGVCVQHPHFLKLCPYTWKCKILQITWRLEISLFFKFFFS
jgi:hypothetical protein